MKKIIIGAGIAVAIVAFVMFGKNAMVPQNVTPEMVQTRINSFASSLSENKVIFLKISDYKMNQTGATAKSSWDFSQVPCYGPFVEEMLWELQRELGVSSDVRQKTSIIDLQHTIEYGPELSNGETGMALVHTTMPLITQVWSEFKQEALRHDVTLPAIDVLTTLGFDERNTIKLSVGDFKFSENGGSVELDAFSSAIWLSNDASKFGLSVNFPKFEFRERRNSFLIHDVLLAGDYYFSPQGNPLGTQDFSIGKIFFTEHNDQFEMTGLKMTSDTTVSSGMINAEGEVTLEKIALHERQRQVFEFVDGLLQMEFKNIDDKVYADFVKVTNESCELSYPSQFEYGTPEYEKAVEEYYAASEKLQNELLDVSLKLLASSPEYNITKFSLSTDKGDFEGSAYIKYNSTGNDELNMSMLRNITVDAELQVKHDVLEHYVASMMSGSGSVSDSELEAVRSQIGFMVTANYITKTSSHYTVSFTMKDGQALFNGNPLPSGLLF